MAKAMAAANAAAPKATPRRDASTDSQTESVKSVNSRRSIGGGTGMAAALQIRREREVSTHKPSPRDTSPQGSQGSSSSSTKETQGTAADTKSSSTPATVDPSGATSEEVLRQLAREREWQQRQKLKAYVATSSFDGTSNTDFYGFGKVLGQGSFAKVRLAWHRLAGIKVIASLSRASTAAAHTFHPRLESSLTIRLN